MVTNFRKDEFILGIHINNKLNQQTNREATNKKEASRFHLQKKLRSINMWCKMMEIFYH